MNAPTTAAKPGLLARFQTRFSALMQFKERALYWFFELPGVSKFFKLITPNQLCYFRMFAGIFVLWFLMRNVQPWAFILFIVAVVTDFIDGPLARWKKEVTEEGKNLDPAADKMLISIPLLIIGVYSFKELTTAMFLFLEFILMFTANILKPYLRTKFGIPLSAGANAFGQIKMFIQSVAMSVIVWNPRNPSLLQIGEMLVWVGIFFAILSFLRHLARMDYPVEKYKRIITVPNLITLSGIFLSVPAIIALIEHRPRLSLAIIGWMFLSDFLDGFVAKVFKQRTAFGAVIDPVRDFLARMIVACWMFQSLGQDSTQALIVAVILVEIFISIINIRHARLWKSVSLVTKIGKIRTFIHFMIFAILLIHTFEYVHLSDVAVFSLVGIILCASLFALYSYSSQRPPQKA